LWTAKAFYDILGVIPKYIRPPLGDIDDRVRDVIAQLGLIPVIWNIDSRDTGLVAATNANIAAITNAFAGRFTNLDTLTSTFTNGIILLEHDNNVATVNFFQTQVLAAIKTLPFKTVTMSECLQQNSWAFGGKAPGGPNPLTSDAVSTTSMNKYVAFGIIFSLAFVLTAF
jgi:hypothetical protein